MRNVTIDELRMWAVDDGWRGEADMPRSLVWNRKLFRVAIVGRMSTALRRRFKVEAPHWLTDLPIEINTP